MDSSSGGQGMTLAGFPHSEICGSQPICGSPQLIAAYHVLHRLLTPRHPPYALSSLTEHSDARWLALPVNPIFSCQRPLTRRRTSPARAAAIYGSRSGLAFRRIPLGTYLVEI